MFENSEDNLEDLGAFEDVLAVRVLKCELDESCGIRPESPPMCSLIALCTLLILTCYG